MRATESNEDEARQKRLRRLAQRHGLKLRKSYPSKHDPRRNDKAWLVSATINDPPGGLDANGLPNFQQPETLDEIEGFLTSLPAPTTGRTIRDKDGSTVYSMA
jgi:hypothetical protein